MERERQATAERRYQAFFHGGATGNDPDPQFGREVPASSQGIDAGFAMSPPSCDIDPGFTWVAAGPNRLRRVRIATDRPPALPGEASFDRGAFPTDGFLRSDLNYRPPASAPPINSGFRPAGARAAQTIAYGAWRAPAPSNQELAELRRQQAAFADTTRKIDLQNSWFAVPALAAPLAVMGLEGAAAWAARTALPRAEQAALQFVKRDPYPRVGDFWATRAGRRGHAALKERLAQKPGWDYEPKLLREGQRPLKPDMGTPKRNPQFPDKRKYIELKPDSPSGRVAGARALKKYQAVTNDPVRLLFYNLKDFI